MATTTITTTRSRNRVNADLEKAIRADPYDNAAYMVYADWLQAEGDPRGELAALHVARKHDAARAFLDAHADYFLGALKDHQETRDDELQNNNRINSEDWVRENKQAFLWKAGFIHRLRLSHNTWADDGFKGTLANDVLAPVLAHPSGKFITEIAINGNGDTSDTLQDIIDVLAERAPETLRVLHFGDNVDQISWYCVGDLSKLWPAVPRLRRLEIEAGEFTLGKIDAPELEHAVFHTGGLAAANMRSICEARWPMIEHLEVYIGEPNYGATTQIEDVLPLLERTDLTELEYLGIKNAEFQDALVRYLAKSPLLKQLDTLDISLGILTDDCVDYLQRDKDAFAHLTLDVSETYLSKSAQDALASICKQLIANDMRNDDGENRYVRVGE